MALPTFKTVRKARDCLLCIHNRRPKSICQGVELALRGFASSFPTACKLVPRNGQDFCEEPLIAHFGIRAHRERNTTETQRLATHEWKAIRERGVAELLIRSVEGIRTRWTRSKYGCEPRSSYPSAGPENSEPADSPQSVVLHLFSLRIPSTTYLKNSSLLPLEAHVGAVQVRSNRLGESSSDDCKQSRKR